MANRAIEIRDTTAARVGSILLFGGRVQRNSALPTKDSQVPCCLVYFGGDTMVAEGDANAGEPNFVHSLRLAVSGLVKADSAAFLDGALDDAMEAILSVLLHDGEWVGLSEAIERIDRTYEFHERDRLLMAEARLVFTLSYRSDWPPVVTDLLESVAMRRDDEQANEPFGVDLYPPDGSIEAEVVITIPQD